MIVEKESKKYYYLFLLLLLATCFQNLTLINFSGFSLKYSHILSLIFIPLLINSKKIKMPGKGITIFFVYMITISIINLFIYGFDNLLLNYIFSYYYLILILTFGNNIPKERWLNIMQKAAVIILIAVIIKDILNMSIFIEFFKNPYVHPNIFTIFGGGVNMEATWLALFGVFFYKKKNGVIYSILSLIISAVYASRVGIIASLIVLFANYKSTNERIKRKNTIKLSNLLYILIAFIALYIMYDKGLFEYVIKRFLSTGDEPGSIGRISMWKYVIDAFKNNPFGYGLGNAIKAIELVSNTKCYDSNVHNIFFQMLLDVGFVGLIYYCSICIKFIIIELKNFFKNPYVAFILLYLLLSFVQFRGGDALLFFVVGIYLLQRKEGNKNE